MITQSQPRAEFWSILAGLRFFFAMWVLFDHTYNFGPAERAMPVFTKSGLMAVICFFIISGFSIHHSITVRPEGYARRRFWRIFPMNALAVGIGWFAWSILGLSGGYSTPQIAPGIFDYIGCLLFLQVFLPVQIEFLYPAWSLSIEALYYSLAPFLTRRSLLPVVLPILIASCAFFIAWPYFRDEYIAARYSYEYAAAALIWAWLAGWVAYSNPHNRIYLAGLVGSGLIGIYTQEKYFAIVDFTSAAANCLALVGTLFIVFTRFGAIASDRCNKILNYLGEISFPLYLLHYPILFALTSSILKTHPQWNYGIVQVAASLACAMVAYQFIDRPLRRQ